MRKPTAVRSLVLKGLLAGSMAGLCGPVLAADGFAAPGDADLWPSWQARLTLTTSQGAGLALAPAHTVTQAALLGDWYLTGEGQAAGKRWRGGLRATGGLVLGHLGHEAAVSTSPWSVSLLSASDARQVDAGLRPYLGIGYAGASADGGFSVSADLGLVADRHGALFGAEGQNNLLRRLELSPMLRVGVNYAF